MLRLVSPALTPIGAVSYRDRLRTGLVGRKSAPVLHGRATGLPDGLAGLVLLADLQGSGGSSSAQRLPLFDALESLADLARIYAIPALTEMWFVSAGDLFAHLDCHKRGGSGDVRPCWLAMRDAGLGVVGVAGNHDRFGDTPAEVAAFGRTPRVHLLDSTTRRVGGLRMAGISGIVGDPKRRPFRHLPEVFLAHLDRLCAEGPDLLILHQGPVPPREPEGINARIRARCARMGRGLVVYGHTPHDAVVEECTTGVQFLNVHERVVVLSADPVGARLPQGQAEPKGAARTVRSGE